MDLKSGPRREKSVRRVLGGVLDEIDSPPFLGVRYHAHGAEADGTFHDGVGRGVRRSRLDEKLLLAAEAAGARVIRGLAERFEVTAVSRGSDAQGRATVRATIGPSRYKGTGVSTDIVEAAAHAMVSIMNRHQQHLGRQPDEDRLKAAI